MLAQNLLRVAACAFAWLVGSAAFAQDASTGTGTGPQGRAGMGQPAVVLSAASEEAQLSLVLKDLDDKPGADDLAAGLIVSTLQPGLMARPRVELLQATREGAADSKDYSVSLRISGLFAFGDSSAPLLYKGREVETLRFARPGLVARAAGEGGHVAREGSDLLFPLVLDNPSGHAYRSVRARLRFADKDVCDMAVDAFPVALPTLAVPAPTGTVTPAKDTTEGSACRSHLSWSPFSVPRYAQVTLRVKPAPEWFREPGSSVARSSKKKGLLTLRFEGDAPGVVFEQNLPLEVQFEPTTLSLLGSLLRVGLLLLGGAGISLLLRVSVPNIKRKRALRDRLGEAAKLTASISSEVDSTLRVLLRVERLALDETRQEAFAIGPSYADFANRVEQALPTLTRRIEAVRRLDTTLIRLRLLLEQNPAPTRVEQVQNQLAAVSETLKQDNLSDEDWVFVNQRLEAAQKALREPTTTEKEAFDAMLSGRWKGLRAHFGIDADGGLKVPDSLSAMAGCFPDHSLLPAPDDEDGTTWIQAVGPTRADLQLSALTLIWDFQFLQPRNASDDIWTQAQIDLAKLLATPVASNLNEARSLLRQLAEGITEDRIKQALVDGAVSIVMDPAIPRPNQRIRFSVRFRDNALNLSAARDLIACHWTFGDHKSSSLARVGRNLPSLASKWAGAGDASQEAPNPPVHEEGWSVHHYFEKDVDRTSISVSFHDSEGRRIDLPPPGQAPGEGVWHCREEGVAVSRHRQEQWGRFTLEVFQLAAALLVPLATLASQTVNEGGVGNWWQLVAIGFASDTIKSILVGKSESGGG